MEETEPSVSRNEGIDHWVNWGISFRSAKELSGIAYAVLCGVRAKLVPANGSKAWREGHHGQCRVDAFNVFRIIKSLFLPQRKPLIWKRFIIRHLLINRVVCCRENISLVAIVSASLHRQKVWKIRCS